MRGLGWAVAAACLGAMALGACAPRPAERDHAKWSGWYQSDTLRDGLRPRVMRLLIQTDTTADMSVDFEGLGTTHHPGWWAGRGDELTMQPTRGDGTPNELPFRWRLEGGRLVPLAWDHKVYGERAVTLTKLVAPARTADSAAGAGR